LFITDGTNTSCIVTYNYINDYLFVLKTCFNLITFSLNVKDIQIFLYNFVKSKKYKTIQLFLYIFFAKIKNLCKSKIISNSHKSQKSLQNCHQI